MTLREEIFEIIRQRYFPHEYKLVASNVYEIIKLFENLIDKKIMSIECSRKSWNNETDYERGCFFAELNAIKQLKKELEK